MSDETGPGNPGSDGMSKSGDDRVDLHLDAILAEVRLLSDTLSTARRRLDEEGNWSSETPNRLKTDLPRILTTVFDLEGKLDAIKRERSAARNEFELDLDAAKFEIGRRLDLIRRARISESVSGDA